MKSAEAAAVFAGMKRGDARTIVNFGQFYLLHVIVEILRVVGEADVSMSLWSSSGRELDALLPEFFKRVRRLRVICDTNFERHQLEFCYRLRAEFGDCLRALPNHAKFVVIQGGGRSVVISSTMNLYGDHRLEVIDIVDDEGMARFLTDEVARVFQTAEAPEETHQQFCLFPEIDGGDLGPLVVPHCTHRAYYDETE